MGRFGDIKAGDILDLRVNEELSVADDPRFEPVQELKPLPTVKLRGTAGVDLRQIEWSHKTLERYLRTKASGLRKIAQAMVCIGCPIIVHEHHSLDDAVDIIMREAIRNGWHLLGRDKQLELPGAQQGDEVPPDDEQVPEDPNKALDITSGDVVPLLTEPEAEQQKDPEETQQFVPKEVEEKEVKTSAPAATAKPESAKPSQPMRKRRK